MTSSSSMHETGHSKPGALEQSRGMGWEGRWEGDSGQVGHVCTHG